MNFKKSLKITASVLGLGLFLSLATGSVQSSVTNSSVWDTFSYDENDGVRTVMAVAGQQAGGGSPTLPRVKWVFPTGGPVASSPAIGSDGTIYIGSYDGFLYAINPDGSLKWRFFTEHNSQIYGSPTVDSTGSHDVIYVGTRHISKPYDKNYLYAINYDGTQKWKFHPGSWLESSPAIGSDRTIYIGCTDTYLYAINPDGSVKWKFSAGREHHIGSSPSIGSDGTIYFGTHKAFYAITDGGNFAIKKWDIYFGDWISSSAAISSDNKTVYVGAFNNSKKVYAINTNNGSIKWEFTTGDKVYSSPAISADGKTIYIGSGDKNLYALSAADGKMKWKFAASAPVGSSPAIGSDGTIYVGSWKCPRDGSCDGYFYAINPDGTEKWKFRAPVLSSPVIAPDGTIYVGSREASSGKLYAIDGGPNVSLAHTPWPMFRHDIRHTGNVLTSIP